MSLLRKFAHADRLRKKTGVNKEAITRKLGPERKAPCNSINDQSHAIQ